ncbi:MAG: Asp-tRNA(Asn)/Glu-tRNA(Gln) amidotransferase subunit GatC [Patescibacteria group bacterium]|jgi:aspartyl-tRNA(Asn)/glutamyl-tRNA(Gln) amidotransferase subunit C
MKSKTAHITLSISDVSHIADLVKLQLTEEEKQKFAQELTDTLKHIENLNELDTSKIDPTYQTTGLVNRYNEEKIGERTMPTEKALQNAPHKKETLFKIQGMNYGK